MASPEQHQKMFVSLLQRLGSPTPAYPDFEWALDVPAGRRLVEFFVDQLGEDITGVGLLETKSLRAQYRTTMRDIALENEEVQSIKRALSMGLIEATDLEAGDVCRFIPEYMCPAASGAQVEFIDTEIQLLEEHVQKVRCRLKSTKMAMNKTESSIEALQLNIAEKDNSIQSKEYSLQDLSLNVDGAIASAVDAAVCLVNELSSDGYVQDKSSCGPLGTLVDLRTSLASMMSARSRMVHFLKEQLCEIDAASSDLPSSESVKRDATRLQRVLTEKAVWTGLAKVNLSEAGQETAYRQQLALVAESMNEQSASDVLYGLQDDSNTLPVSDEDLNPTIDAEAELQTAWNSDQVTLLEMHESLVKDATDVLKNNISHHLLHIYERLCAIDDVTRETQALIGALVEEMEQIVDDVCEGKADQRAMCEEAYGAEKDDQSLETKLMDLLKMHKDIRVASSPLLLLNSEDLSQELRCLALKMKDQRQREQDEAKYVFRALEDLRRDNHQLVAATYRHSPMITSRPYALPRELKTLQNYTAERCRALSADITRLQKDGETMITGRTKRKLDSFVRKWGK